MKNRIAKDKNEFVEEVADAVARKQTEPKALIRFKENVEEVKYQTNNDSNSENKPKRTRKTNLIRAIEKAIESFNSKPSFNELWQFFQDDKDETGFIEDYTDTHLTWRDTKGKFHDTKKTR